MRGLIQSDSVNAVLSTSCVSNQNHQYLIQSDSVNAIRIISI